MILDIVTVARAMGFVVWFIVVMGTIGMPMALWLQARKWSEYSILSAPLLGWSILTSWCYFSLTFLTFGPALLLLCVMLVGILIIWRVGVSTLRGEAGARVTRHILYSLLFIIFGYVTYLLPYFSQQTLSIVVPNQDEEYFVEIADMFWASPQGSRLKMTGYHLETGWGFHIAIALARLLPFVHAFEAVMLVGYATLLLMAGGIFVLARECLRMPMAWALGMAIIAPLHSLVLWVPGYAFGPNAVAAAVLPWYAVALLHGLLHASRANGVMLSLTTGMLLMAYTKVTAIQIACIGVGITLVGGWSVGTGNRAIMRRIRDVIGWHILGAGIAFGSLADSLIWLFGGGLSKASRLLSDAEETTGAGWGLKTFPGLGAWLGTEPWDFLRARLELGDAVWLDGVSLAGTVAGVAFAILGLVSPRMQELRVGTRVLLIGHVIFFVYARVFKAFPYAVFKLQSLSGILLVIVVIVGMRDVILGVRRGEWWLVSTTSMGVWSRTFMRYAGFAGIATYLLAFGIASTTVMAFYLLPFGVTIRTATVDELARVVNRIPAGSTIEVSNQIRGAMNEHAFSPTTHPIGFATVSVANRATGDRIRAFLTHSLRLRDINPIGIFGREVNNTVRVPDREGASYLIVGAAEDLRIRGLSSERIVESGTLLRLIARPSGAVQGVYRLTGESTAKWSVQCASDTPSGPCSTQSSLIGLFASDQTVVQLHFQCDALQTHAQVMLRRGFTWYRSGPLATPCAVTARLDEPSPSATVWVATSSVGQTAGEPALSRPDRTIAAVHADVNADGALNLTVAVASAMAESSTQDLRVALVSTPIGPGQMTATDADPSRPYQEWRWTISPGREINQYINGNHIRMPIQPVWPDIDGAFWVRVALTEGVTTWHEVPLVAGTLSQGRIQNVHVLSPVFDVPFLNLHPVPQVAIHPSWHVVRGSGDRIYLVEDGTLRWIPDLEVFTRRGLKWEDVVTIGNEDMDSIPLGLPLD